MKAFGVDKVPALVILQGNEINKYDGESFFLLRSLGRTIADSNGRKYRSTQV
jgi:hypothetical protein